MDDQEKYQIRRIAETMATEGWGFLMAAWAQKREAKILAHLKRATKEDSWRKHQGRLEGFDEAVMLPEMLASQLNESREEQEAERERQRIVNELTGEKS